jgi:hypothetical protein
MRAIRLKIEIKTTREYSQDDLKNMKDIFQKSGFQVSAEKTLFKKAIEVPPDIMIVLSFFLGLAGGAYIAGFFKQMGADTWNLLKEGIKKLFNKKKDDLHPRILLKLPSGDDKYVLCFVEVDNENELDEALTTLEEFLEKSKLRRSEIKNWLPIFYYPDKGWVLPLRPEK